MVHRGSARSSTRRVSACSATGRPGSSRDRTRWRSPRSEAGARVWVFDQPGDQLPHSVRAQGGQAQVPGAGGDQVGQSLVGGGDPGASGPGGRWSCATGLGAGAGRWIGTVRRRSGRGCVGRRCRSRGHWFLRFLSGAVQVRRSPSGEPRSSPEGGGGRPLDGRAGRPG